MGSYRRNRNKKQNQERKKKINSIKKKSKPKSYSNKIQDKKINTIVELRMKEIAEAEISKNIPKQILREFTNGTYDYPTNAYASQLINHTGSTQEVCKILKLSSLTTRDVSGSRIGNEVQITGFGLIIRYLLAENNSLADIDQCVLKYSLVRVQDDWQRDGAAPTAPVMADINKWFPFGYSSRLDDQLTASITDRKVWKIISGTISKKSTEISAQTIVKKIYRKLENPITMLYKHTDNTGDCNPIQYRYYLSFRSNVPNGTVDQAMFPKICVCLKTYYTET